MSRPTESIEVRRAGIVLAGSIWRPPGVPRCVVVMHPGSGPSDRDNDVYFPPIRDILLQAGCAVASFDKRGAGASTGDWRKADIGVQAADLVDCATAVVDRLPGAPLGIFGHSQGGWVAVEAASGQPRPASAWADAALEIEFVVTNSGPGVTPADQERHAAATAFVDAGWSAEQAAEGTDCFEEVLAALQHREALADFRARMTAAGRSELLERIAAHAFVPDDVAIWDFAGRIIDYDPAPMLAAMVVPVLALFGADDTVVPVEASVEVYRKAVPPHLLTLAVLPGGDHRIQTGSPPMPAPGYREALIGFVDEVLRSRA